MPDQVPVPFDAEQPPKSGERASFGIPEENYWFQRRAVAYGLAAQIARGRHVLDVGCGEGYGADLLAGTADQVVGLDTDADVVRRAEAVAPRASFKTGELISLPFPDAAFGAVVAVNVIEQFHIPQEFFAECARVLKPGGVLILSTPNRLTSSTPGMHNPFHAFEFAATELRRALDQRFTRYELRGTFHGPRLRLVELLLRRHLPERLVDQPAYEWPRWLREIVARITTGDFRIQSGNLERCLDLLAIVHT